jgi:type I restriction enzyme S subunit
MNGWQTVTLRDVADVFNGKTPSLADQRSSGHPVLKIKDISEAGAFRGTFDSFVDEPFAAVVQQKQIREGDTLILNAAHNADYVASKTYRATGPTVGALATGEWLIIRARDHSIDPDFVYHWVNTPSTRHRLRRLVKGIHLYPIDVARLSLPLPPLPEQRRLGVILDKADALRAKRQSTLSRLNSLVEAIFFEMFGDPVLNNRKWPTATVASFCELVRGSSPRPQGDPRYFGGQVPRLMVADVTRDGWSVTPRIDSLTEEGATFSRPVSAGTVVMAVSGDVGVVSRLTGRAARKVIHSPLGK